MLQASLGAAAVLLAAQSGLAGELRGQAVLSQPFPLPTEAVLDVQLIEQDSSGPGSTVLRGRSLAPVGGRSPFAFTVPYLDASIRTPGRYGLRASIRQGDRLLFLSGEPVPVLSGRPAPAPLVLQPVGDAPLRGLLWPPACQPQPMHPDRSSSSGWIP